MKFRRLSIPDVVLFEPDIFRDHRGELFESFNEKNFTEAIARQVQFVQENHSISSQGVLRGLHYQEPHQQGKLVRVIQGEIFDVAVDIRPDSLTYGRWVAEKLSSKNKKQLWVPEGFAHGFLVLSKTAEIIYKLTDFYNPECEKCILWNDQDLGIDWPNTSAPKLSLRDENALPFSKLSIK